MRDEANENFRRIAVALAQQARSPGHNAFLFTSANRREGTTTTVLNVARNLASGCGLKTLVVELNAHQPALSRLFALDASRNLQAIATDRLQPREAVQNGSPGVPVIASGRNGDGTELALPRVMRRILAELGSEYDVILFDAPAMLEHADAATAATVVPRVVLVVEAGRTRWEVLDRIKRELEGSQAQVVATVLNKHKRFIPGWIYRAFVR